MHVSGVNDDRNAGGVNQQKADDMIDHNYFDCAADRMVAKSVDAVEKHNDKDLAWMNSLKTEPMIEVHIDQVDHKAVRRPDFEDMQPAVERNEVKVHWAVLNKAVEDSDLFELDESVEVIDYRSLVDPSVVIQNILWV